MRPRPRSQTFEVARCARTAPTGAGADRRVAARARVVRRRAACAGRGAESARRRCASLAAVTRRTSVHPDRREELARLVLARLDCGPRAKTVAQATDRLPASAAPSAAACSRRAAPARARACDPRAAREKAAEESAESGDASERRRSDRHRSLSRRWATRVDACCSGCASIRRTGLPQRKRQPADGGGCRRAARLRTRTARGDARSLATGRTRWLPDSWRTRSRRCRTGARSVAAAMFRRPPTIDRGDLAADIARFVPMPCRSSGWINFRNHRHDRAAAAGGSHPVARVAISRSTSAHAPLRNRTQVRPRPGRHRADRPPAQVLHYVSVTPLMTSRAWRRSTASRRLARSRRSRALPRRARRGGDRRRSDSCRAAGAAAHDAAARVSVGVDGAVGRIARAAEARFGCPVLDVTRSNEWVGRGFDAAAGGHVLLQPQLFVEILDARGSASRRRARRDHVTGGFNFCLPLLRYRNGDHGALVAGVDAPVIVDWSDDGRLRFRNAAGVVQQHRREAMRSGCWRCRASACTSTPMAPGVVARARRNGAGGCGAGGVAADVR